ncbi:glutamine amidotransferase [Stieleria sp. JC731]|uniref:glutamine amidotransferase n=1 Tax=Pirellulaceae TaxID=2691357 RepID=UPI001E3BFD5A|nr:glutamine amidotransferase [Stieleria sp. JC731]MCC9604019.1 glutamine amidotransferase [Stieleria sp. JC731]
MISIPIAETFVRWDSPLQRWEWIALFASALLVWMVLRVIWGASLVRERHGLMILRAIAIAIVLVILMGPSIIDQQPGETTRSRMIYLFDGSQSMQLGGESDRWQQAISFTRSAHDQAGPEQAADVQAFRFGHRLEPFVKSNPDQAANRKLPTWLATESSDSIRLVGTNNVDADSTLIEKPDASDSRLADALRQLLPQVRGKSSAGVVLLSDGRVRASESVEKLGEIFGQTGVPIHVVPIGEAGGSGDIAIVSLVVPARVRKFTENELQVFLRSFGFPGQQTTVRVLRKSTKTGGEYTEVNSLPITLTGGAQSASLTFRVDDRPEDLIVSVDPIEGELSTKNNRVETHVEIDRTKVRVLSIQADRPAPVSQSSFLGGLFGNLGSPNSDSTSIQSALQSDEDIECTVLLSIGGQTLRRLAANGSQQSGAGFPKTRAELFAYDCVILNEVAANVLDDEQQQWLAQWIDGRGGGLIVTGSGAMNQRAWKDTVLEPLLPVTLDSASPNYPLSAPVQITQPLHPIWRLRMEQMLNEQILQRLPNLSVAVGDLTAKPTATVLAKTADEGKPVMVSQRAGRGRIMVSSASLSGSPLDDLAQNWGDQPERVAAKFWRNLVYWATEESSTGRRRLVVSSNQRFYRPGQRLQVRATSYDEAARRTTNYRVWAMFEPESLDDMSLYSPVLWPDNVVRESGEVGPRIAWGEELPLRVNGEEDIYEMDLMLSESVAAADSGMRIELTAYEGEDTGMAFSHGTQVDSTSLAVQILSDPFEQQNPLPNHELMSRLASVSGGKVLERPEQLTQLLRDREEYHGPSKVDSSPAWNRTWLWFGLIGILTVEWIWRRTTGLA